MTDDRRPINVPEWGWLLTPDSEEAGAWNIPPLSGREIVSDEVVDQILESAQSSWERHTVDRDREQRAVEKPPSRGAMWAWIAMGAFVALYCIWRGWK